MDQARALEVLRIGEYKLSQRSTTVQKRENYVRGVQDLPFAPQGVNQEYETLREQAIANWLDLWAYAPVQRLHGDNIRTDMGSFDESETVDQVVWRDVFQANQWDTRQSNVYRSITTHGRGIVSVWPNSKNKQRPIVRPEPFSLVHIEMDPEDPFTPAWAVKVFQVEDMAPSQLWLPGGVTRTRTIGIVYDAENMWRFEKGGLAGTGDWAVEGNSTHPMGEVPFVPFDYRPDDLGNPWSGLDQMIPQQDALNTIRFNTLLAMQFSAFRQRIVSGFDPRVVDAEGNIVYRTNDDGSMLLDEQGNPMPLIASPGRAGVDRMIVFPGADTKVFDLPESNLKNYIEVHENFLVNFFAKGQIPPQYLLSRMVNLSGDALSGAESTFASLLKEMQQVASDGNEKVAELAWKARGEDQAWNPSAEFHWQDAEARSFAQIVDAIVKLVTTGFPRRSAWEMIPGATSQKVDRWMDEAEDELGRGALDMFKSQFTDTTAVAGEFAPVEE